MAVMPPLPFPFIIPDEIQLMCRTIRVKLVTDLMYRIDHRGEASFRQNEIRIQAATESVDIPYDHQVETYFHEVLHWVFNLIQRADLGDDEDLIEEMGKLLAQAALTARKKL